MDSLIIEIPNLMVPFILFLCWILGIVASVYIGIIVGELCTFIPSVSRLEIGALIYLIFFSVAFPVTYVILSVMFLIMTR